MDDGVQPPKPRTAAKPGVTPRTASGAKPVKRPADPRTDATLAKKSALRPTARPVAKKAAGSHSPVVSTGDATADVVLPPVPDGTPLSIPRIIPAEPPSSPSTSMPRPDARHTTGVIPAVPVVTPDVAVPSAMPGVGEFTDTDGTDGLPSMQRPVQPTRGLRAPAIVRRPRRPRVRRVTRVVRQIDTWSVFKVALVFNLFLYLVSLTAGVLLWQVAQNTGTVDNVERFFESFGWQTFQLKGGTIYHNAWVAGLFLVVGVTGLAVLLATVFNLIADLVGGIRVTVLEEEVIAREDRGLGWRRAGSDDATGGTSRPER